MDGSDFLEDPGIDFFEGLNLYDLKLDEAYLRVSSEVKDIFVYKLSGDCYGVSTTAS